MASPASCAWSGRPADTAGGTFRRRETGLAARTRSNRSDSFVARTRPLGCTGFLTGSRPVRPDSLVARARSLRSAGIVTAAGACHDLTRRLSAATLPPPASRHTSSRPDAQIPFGKHPAGLFAPTPYAEPGSEAQFMEHPAGMGKEIVSQRIRFRFFIRHGGGSRFLHLIDPGAGIPQQDG